MVFPVATRRRSPGVLSKSWQRIGELSLEGMSLSEDTPAYELPDWMAALWVEKEEIMALGRKRDSLSW